MLVSGNYIVMDSDTQEVMRKGSGLSWTHLPENYKLFPTTKAAIDKTLSLGLRHLCTFEIKEVSYLDKERIAKHSKSTN